MIASNTIVGGRYRVMRPLGGGGMKLVYLAEDLRLASRECALAEMVDTFTSPETQKQAVAAFQREADMLAQLSNEHIPRVFDRFSDQNHHYLVMEYIDGITLEQKLQNAGGKLTETEVIDVALQVLDTLEYLHNLEPPVIYRDLKPSNVMLTPSDQVKLIDFGIARLFQPLSNATMIGTQGYAPPEQYRGKVEFRSDLYALGATMHHALSGRDPAVEPPFSFPPLRSLCPDITPALCELIDQALKYDVVLRVADAAEFRQRLIAIKSGAPIAMPQRNSATAPSSRPQLKLPLSEQRACVRADDAEQSDRHAMSAMRPEHPGGFELLLVLRGRRDGTIVGAGSRRDARGADDHSRRRRFASRISGSDLSRASTPPASRANAGAGGWRIFSFGVPDFPFVAAAAVRR